MDPLEITSAFGTIVQLICNFRQERGAAKAAELTDFLSYLAYHKFEEIKGAIQGSTGLQLEIQELLKRDVGEVNEKLELINRSIVVLASRIDGLSGLASTLGGRAAKLSDQAIQILQGFESSSSTKLGVFRSFDPPVCVLFPEGKQFTADRFLVEDIEALQMFGFIILAEHNRDGDPLYTLTRAGAEYARSVEAKS